MLEAFCFIMIGSCLGFVLGAKINQSCHNKLISISKRILRSFIQAQLDSPYIELLKEAIREADPNDKVPELSLVNRVRTDGKRSENARESEANHHRDGFGDGGDG